MAIRHFPECEGGGSGFGWLVTARHARPKLRHRSRAILEVNVRPDNRYLKDLIQHDGIREEIGVEGEIGVALAG